MRSSQGGVAYCGEVAGDFLEQDHILPRAQWFFDSYLNVLPACQRCNGRIKSAATPLAAGLSIHPDAYQAYCAYLERIKRTRPWHILHAAKKGLLNLLTDPARHWDAERFIQLIGSNLTTVVQTQRGPRPLARYLLTRLLAHSGRRADLSFRSGRHTCLYRTVAYPDFDKSRDKAEAGVINHAVDAVILASELPAPTLFEQRGIAAQALQGWVRAVRSQAAKAGTDGYPTVQDSSVPVPGFETCHPGGVLEVDLGLFNWNRKDRAVHKQNPYGVRDGVGPVQRKSAASVRHDVANTSSRESALAIVRCIQHRGLRIKVEQAAQGPTPGKAAAAALREWLRDSVSKSLPHSDFSSHPADQARRRDLEQFAAGKTDTIPAVIGVGMEDRGAKGVTYLVKVVGPGSTRSHHHHFAAQPSNAGVVLGYRADARGQIDRQKPVTFALRQDGSLRPDSARWPIPPDGLLSGRRYGEPRVHEADWTAALDTYLRTGGVKEYFILRQGTVLVYENQSQRFVRNFKREPGGFSGAMLKGVVSIRRTPLAQESRPAVRLA
jgi:hypothetical protein